MSRLATARTQLHAALITVLPDRSFLSEADAGTMLPAAFVDTLEIVAYDTAAVCTIEASVTVLVDGTDGAQVTQSDEYAEAIYIACANAGWKPIRCSNENRLQLISDDTAQPRITGYRITALRALRSA